MGTQWEKNMVRRVVFMGSIMGDEISEHSSACHKKSCKISWVPMMLGTQMLWVRDFLFHFWKKTITFCWVCLAGKMPASNILYNLLWVQEDERRARIVHPVGKKYGCSMDWTCDFKLKDQHLSHLTTRTFWYLQIFNLISFWYLLPSLRAKMKNDLFFLVLGLVIVTVASAPERAGQNRPSRIRTDQVALHHTRRCRPTPPLTLTSAQEHLEARVTRGNLHNDSPRPNEQGLWVRGRIATTSSLRFDQSTPVGAVHAATTTAAVVSRVLPSNSHRLVRTCHLDASFFLIQGHLDRTPSPGIRLGSNRTLKHAAPSQWIPGRPLCATGSWHSAILWQVTSGYVLTRFKPDASRSRKLKSKKTTHAGVGTRS